MILIKVLKKEARFYLYSISAQETQGHNTIEELHQIIKEKERKRERERVT